MAPRGVCSLTPLYSEYLQGSTTSFLQRQGPKEMPSGESNSSYFQNKKSAQARGFQPSQE